MRARRHPAILAAASVAALAAITGATAAAAPPDGAQRGPTTAVDPYVIPVAPGVSTVSLLTVGDEEKAENGYRMVGIPDGMGARKGPGHTLELFMNHELRNTQGIPRRHLQQGAFVSQWRIDTRTLAVKSGEDLIDPGVTYWNYPAAAESATASPGGPNPLHPLDPFELQDNRFSRFCSASLTDPGLLYNRRSGRGYQGQIYFGGEENGDPGRVFGVTTDGTAEQLPRLGLFSWENTNAAANRSDRTLVIGTEDAGPNTALPNPDLAAGQLWAYAGTKSKRGDAFQRAGLTNGVGFVIDALDESVTNDATFRAKYGKNRPADVDLSEIDWNQSATAQNREATAEGLSLNRIEDGAWDPNNPNDFYFLTTEGGDKTPAPAPNAVRDGGGLWRLSWEDIEHPELGATLTLLLDGSEEPKLNKPDNMDIDERGNLLIQEDPGGNAHIARILAYRIADGKLATLAQFDPALFTAGEDDFLTQDEESSGIIDVAGLLGNGWFLFDAQVHLARTGPNAAEQVEHGQMLAMRVKSFRKVYGDEHEDHGHWRD